MKNIKVELSHHFKKILRQKFFYDSQNNISSEVRKKNKQSRTDTFCKRRNFYLFFTLFQITFK